MVARSTKDASDGFVGHAVSSGNVAKRFVLLKHTAHHVGPFFRWNAMVRLTRAWMLLCGDDRGKSAKHLLECKQSLMELTMRGNKVN